MSGKGGARGNTSKDTKYCTTSHRSTGHSRSSAHHHPRANSGNSYHHHRSGGHSGRNSTTNTPNRSSHRSGPSSCHCPTDTNAQTSRVSESKEGCKRNYHFSLSSEAIDIFIYLFFSFSVRRKLHSAVKTRCKQFFFPFKVNDVIALVIALLDMHNAFTV